MKQVTSPIGTFDRRHTLLASRFDTLVRGMRPTRFKYTLAPAPVVGWLAFWQ